MTVDPQAGTPTPEPVVSESAGTAAPPVSNGSETAAAEPKPVDHKLAMEWKSKAEKLNELERSGKLAALETPAPTPTSQPEGGAAQTIPGVDDRELSQAVYAIQAGFATADDRALVSYALSVKQNQEVQRLAYQSALNSIPEAERKGADEMWRTGEYKTLEAARRAWKGTLSPTEYVALYGQKQPEPVREASRPEPVDTSTASIGPNGTQLRLNNDQFIKAMQDAKAKGDTARVSELLKYARGG